MAICFLGSEYFAQRFNRPADENGQKKVLTDFLSPSVNLEFLVKNVPLTLLIGLDYINYWIGLDYMNY